MVRFLTFLLAVICLSTGCAKNKNTVSQAKQKTSEFSKLVDDTGAISRPSDFRSTFIHLGTFVTSSESGSPADELHSVYSRQQDVAAYRKDGQFSDGAVVIKEIHAMKSGEFGEATSSYATDLKLWFVMIKDTKGRFPENKIWAEGWGWAMFNADDPDVNTATDFETDCRSCHEPAKDNDWQFVKGYPLLRPQKAR